MDLVSRAAHFILEHQWIDRRFHRLNYDGMVPNQGNRRWKEMPWKGKAIALQAEFDEWLWSIEQGGSFNTASDASNDLIVRERSYMDNATPSANMVAIANLIRMFLLTDDIDYLEYAEQALNSFLPVLTQAPRACPSLFSALDWSIHQASVKLQSASSETFQTLTTGYFPTAVFKQSRELPKGAIGLVCRGTTCDEPAITAEQLLRQLSFPKI